MQVSSHRTPQMMAAPTHRQPHTGGFNYLPNAQQQQLLQQQQQQEHHPHIQHQHHQAQLQQLHPQIQAQQFLHGNEVGTRPLPANEPTHWDGSVQNMPPMSQAAFHAMQHQHQQQHQQLDQLQAQQQQHLFRHHVEQQEHLEHQHVVHLQERQRQQLQQLQHVHQNKTHQQMPVQAMQTMQGTPLGPPSATMGWQVDQNKQPLLGPPENHTLALHQQQQQQSRPGSQQQSTPTTPGNGGDQDIKKMLNLFIHDYCLKNNFGKTANALTSDTGVRTDEGVPFGGASNEGVLYDCFKVFLESYRGSQRSIHDRTIAEQGTIEQAAQMAFIASRGQSSGSPSTRLLNAPPPNQQQQQQQQQQQRMLQGGIDMRRIESEPVGSLQSSNGSTIQSNHFLMTPKKTTASLASSPPGSAPAAIENGQNTSANSRAPPTNAEISFYMNQLGWGDRAINHLASYERDRLVALVNRSRHHQAEAQNRLFEVHQGSIGGAANAMRGSSGNVFQHSPIHSPSDVHESGPAQPSPGAKKRRRSSINAPTQHVFRAMATPMSQSHTTMGLAPSPMALSSPQTELNKGQGSMSAAAAMRDFEQQQQLALSLKAQSQSIIGRQQQQHQHQHQQQKQQQQHQQHQQQHYQQQQPQHQHGSPAAQTMSTSGRSFSGQGAAGSPPASLMSRSQSQSQAQNQAASLADSMIGAQISKMLEQQQTRGSADQASTSSNMAQIVQLKKLQEKNNARPKTGVKGADSAEDGDESREDAMLISPPSGSRSHQQQQTKTPSTPKNSKRSQKRNSASLALQATTMSKGQGSMGPPPSPSSNLQQQQQQQQAAQEQSQQHARSSMPMPPSVTPPASASLGPSKTPSGLATPISLQSSTDPGHALADVGPVTGLGVMTGQQQGQASMVGNSFNISSDFGLGSSFLDPGMTSSSFASNQPASAVAKAGTQDSTTSSGDVMGNDGDLDFDWRNMLA